MSWLKENILFGCLAGINIGIYLRSEHWVNMFSLGFVVGAWMVLFRDRIKDLIDARSL